MGVMLAIKEKIVHMKKLPQHAKTLQKKRKKLSEKEKEKKRAYGKIYYKSNKKKYREWYLARKARIPVLIKEVENESDLYKEVFGTNID